MGNNSKLSESKGQEILEFEKEDSKIVNSGLKMELVVKPVHTHNKLEYKFLIRRTQIVNGSWPSADLIKR